MIVKDWVTEAAKELAEVTCNEVDVPSAKRIIAKHCPFLPDTVYMRVPRCETCAHWERKQEGSVWAQARCSLHSADGQPDFRTCSTFGCVLHKEKVG